MMNDCICGQECQKPCYFVKQLKEEQEVAIIEASEEASWQDFCDRSSHV